MLVEENQILYLRVIMKKDKGSWFVVMSKPNQEIKALKNLENQNFEVFCPYFEKEVLTGNILKRTKDFLFPSYIFVKFDLSNYGWVKIRNTYGVKNILSCQLIPKCIDSSFIDGLQKFSSNEGLINKNYFSYKPKEKVMITKGPFKKIFGEVLACLGKNRIKVLLNCINGYKTIVTDKDIVIPSL